MSHQDRYGWWTAQFGRREKKLRRRSSIVPPYARRLRVEALEDRRMLTITVDTLVDEEDFSIVDGDISLRDAIAEATPGETIDFSVVGTIELDDLLGELTIDKELTIVGPGQTLLTIDAGHGPDDDPDTGDGYRIFFIDDEDDGSALEVAISGLTLTGGDVGGLGGGAIRTIENLSLTDSTISGNFTTGNGGAILAEYYANVILTRTTVSGNSSSGSGFSTFSGGGVSVAGDLTLNECTVSGNSSAGDYSVGGGIYAKGDVEITESTVSGNYTTGNYAKGGGIYVTFGGSLTITQSTISDNHTTGSESDGGGVYSRAAVMFIDSTASDNRTEGSLSNGGGIWGFGDVTLTNSTVSGNSTEGNGGGIVAYGEITLTRSTVSGNSSTGSGFSTLAGGGIHAAGDLTLNQSTVSGNSSSGSFSSGGGIYAKGIVEINESTISGNFTTGEGSRGGGLYATYSGSVTFTQSTVSGNYTTGDNSHGGGIYTRGDLTVSQSTITDNDAMHATAIGGGIGNFSEPMEINGSILAGNSAGGGNPDLDTGTGALTIDYTLIGDTSGLGAPALTAILVGDGNFVEPDPMLGVLADNGGPTETHALLPGSMALDAGDPSIDFNPAEFDQRGAPFVRVFDDPGAAGTGIDLGAYERQTLAPSYFIVTTTDDELDYTNADVSLREAIKSANGSSGANTVTFDPTVFGTMQTLALTGGDFEITEALTITGTGADLLIIDAQELSRIFDISATSGDFTLTGLSLTGGKTTGDNSDQLDSKHSGAAIRSHTSGLLTLEQSTVSGNHTTGAYADGGAIYAYGDVTLTQSTVNGNSATGYAASGGGIHSSGDVTLTQSSVNENSTTGNTVGGGVHALGNVTLNQSTVSGNSTAGAYSFGGGIRAGGDVMLNQSTVSDNSTSGFAALGGGIYALGAVNIIESAVSGNYTMEFGASGGGIFSYASMTITQSTVSGNFTMGSNSHGGGIYSLNAVMIILSTITDNDAMDATATGGGFWNDDDAIVISGSILAGNSAGGGNPDLNPGTGAFSIDYSLIGDVSGLGVPELNAILMGDGNIVDPAPMLGALADNGGPTETHALLEGSPAIDVGDLTASPGENDVPLFDQRGNNYGRVQNDRIDIGAFEVRDTLSADFNSDGFVTGLDFLAWQRGFGTTAPDATKPEGDGDNDLDVDSSDLGVWELQYGTTPASQVAAATPPVVPASDAVSSKSSQQLQSVSVRAQPLSAELVDAAIVMHRAVRSDSGSHPRPLSFLREGYFDWLSRSTEWFQQPTWQGPSEVADHSFRDQTNKANEGRFHREAYNDAANEALRDELFAEEELSSLL